MARVKVHMKKSGAREFLRSDEMEALLQARANVILDRADKDGVDFAADTMKGRTRARAMVKTVTYYGRIKNARRNVLLKALGDAE